MYELLNLSRLFSETGFHQLLSAIKNWKGPAKIRDRYSVEFQFVVRKCLEKVLLIAYIQYPFSRMQMASCDGAHAFGGVLPCSFRKSFVCQ